MLANPAAAGTLIPHRIEHYDGKKRRIPLDPVPDYYPAAVSMDDYQRVQAMRNGALSPARGRHATAPVKNIIGGLCHCSFCGGSMTLVTKSQQWRYLVCTTARGGAGCKYRGVRYDEVEASILAQLDRIILECPLPSSAVEDALENLEAVLDTLKDDGQALIDELTRTPASTLIRERLIGLESQIARLEAERQELLLRRVENVGPIIEHRLRDLQAVLHAPELNRQALNAALRVLMEDVVIYPNDGIVTFSWRHGGHSTIAFAFTTAEERAEASAKGHSER